MDFRRTNFGFCSSVTTLGSRELTTVIIGTIASDSICCVCTATWGQAASVPHRSDCAMFELWWLVTHCGVSCILCAFHKNAMGFSAFPLRTDLYGIYILVFMTTAGLPFNLNTQFEFEKLYITINSILYLIV